MATQRDRGQEPSQGAETPSAASGAEFDFGQVLRIADALPMPIGLVDRSLAYRFINKAMADFFERPRSEILGKTVAEALGPKAFAERRPMFEAALGGERQWFAATYDHPSRGTLALQAEYLPQRDSAGQVESIVILIQDVTEQRIAERALRESEARFRRIADSAPVLMWVTRADRSRDFVNEAYLEFAGLTPAEAQTHNWRDFIHPDDFDRVIAASLEGEASCRPFTLEARYRRYDGEWRWLRSVSQPRFGADGELVGFIGAAFDITPRKEGELELRRLVDERTAELSASEERLRAVLDTVVETVVLLEPDGTVLYVNNSKAPWRKGAIDEGIGGKIWDRPTERFYDDLGALTREMVAEAAKGEHVRREFVLRRGAMVDATLEMSISPIRGEDGSIELLVLEKRDISELKLAQEQLRQSQKMEALGQLTGGIAHDFNNLLTVVVGGLDLIAKRESDDKLKRYAENALEAAERGARLTAQLLAFSRVQRLEVRPTYVAPLIENMRPLLRNVLGPGIEKKFELDRELRPVMADPTQLELAVLNLAINARDAMPDGGVLGFRTCPIQVRDDPELADGEYVELSISDTGSGMAPEVVERAFEPFFTTKEVGKGTGLGLSMVYGVARQSGGTARITSASGEGTCVRLYFRVAEGDAQSASVDPISSREHDPRKGASVLVIDDDPDVRSFVADSLAELGYRVREAANGEAGLADFRSSPVDLVILDFIMPGLSGADVARAIREQNPGQPILFVSGYSETESIKNAAPDAAMLAKPFRADALDAAVRAALARDNAARA